MIGGWIRWSFWMAFLLEGVCVADQELDHSDTFYEEPALVCEDDLMEYSLQTMASGQARVRLSIQDTNGTLTPLITNASCGIWVIPEPEGLLRVYVRYDACYTDTKAGFHMLTIFLESNVTGEWELYQREVLRCPVTAMDAPTPEECSNIPTQRRLPCDGHSMSQEHCLQSCCYDPLDSVTPCYYGNKVTIQCTGDGQFSVAISKDVTVPPLNLPSVRLLRGSGPECAPVAQNEAFVFFSFPLLACETTHIEDGTSLVYENYFVAEKEKTGRGSLISRDSTFRLHIHCSFVASDSQVHQSVEVFTLTPPPHVTSAGSLTLEMRIAKDSIYGQYYSSEEYPIIKFLGDPVYFEVCILNRNDPTLLLKLEQCWATASEKPFSQPQWRILVDGCPFTGDQYMTQAVTNGDIEVPNPTHYKRFIVHTFTFIGTVSHNAIGRPVYFHCSASVCVPSAAERCATSCPTKRRRALASMRLVMLVSAEGPVAFYVRKKDKLNEGNDGGRSSNLDWMLAIIPGSIFVVILLLLIVLTKIKL